PGPSRCWRCWPRRNAAGWLRCCWTTRSGPDPCVITNPCAVKETAMAKRPRGPTPAPLPPVPPPDLRQRLLTDLATVKVAVTAEALDDVLAQAERAGWSPLEFATRLLGAAAGRRRERSLERRLQDARFRDAATLETFDWQFNAATIPRGQLEELASCA